MGGTGVDVIVMTLNGAALPDVYIDWNASVDPNFLNYEVYRADNVGMVGAVLLTTILNVGDHEWTDVGPGDDVWYYMITVNYTVGLPTDSNIDYIDTITDEPDIQALTPGFGNDIYVSWDESENADFDRYILYRSKDGGAFSNIYATNDRLTTTYADEVLDPGEYTYYLVTRYTTHRSDQGLPAIFTGSEISAEVEDPYDLEVVADEHEVVLSWVADPHLAFKNYKIYRSSTPGVDGTSTLIATITDASITTHTDSPGPGRWYYNVLVEMT